MFGKKENRLETIVGPGSRITGELATRGTVRVDGEIEGEVTADLVVVGEGGRIAGTVRSKRLVVGGRIDGDVESEELVELREKAVLRGEVRTARMAIREGALFEGNCRMGDAEPAARAHRGGQAGEEEVQVIPLRQ